MKSFFLLLFLIFFSGCGASPFVSQPPAQTNPSSEDKTSVSEQVIQEPAVVQEEKQESTGSSLPKEAYVLLISASCDKDIYLQQAEEVFRDQQVGDYIILVGAFSDPPAIDSCVVLSFSAQDRSQVKEIAKLLQSDLQKQLQKANWQNLKEELPGTCEEIIAYVKQKYPRFADRITKRCEQEQEQQEGESSFEGDETLQYENNNPACSLAPEKTCAPAMDSSEYVRYAMNFVTPTDMTVKAKAGEFSSIDSLYTFAQIQPWQSDTSLFGCADKFQLPSYYLESSPQLESAGLCGYASGDCEDQALDLVSLLLASGLVQEGNVRVALGIIQTGGAPWQVGGHAWPEVYMDGHWFPLDPTFGSYCDENGSCTLYTEDQLIDWDYFRFVMYPVVQYWGWSDKDRYYIPSTGEGSADLPTYWKDPATTISPF